MDEVIRSLEEALDQMRTGGEEAEAALVEPDTLAAAKAAEMAIPWPILLCIVPCVIRLLKDKDVKAFITCLIKCLTK